MAGRVTQTSFNQLGPVLTGTAAAVGTIAVDGFRTLTFAYAGLTAETVKVEGSINSVDFATTAGMRPTNASTGAITASSDLAAATNSSVMRLDVTGLKSVRFVKSATTEDITVRTCLS